MALTPQQVSATNAAREANVNAGKSAYSGAGATEYSTSQGLGGPITAQNNAISASVNPASPTPQVNTSQATATPLDPTKTTTATNPAVPAQVANNLSQPSGLTGFPDLHGTQQEQATQAIDQLKQKYGTALTTLNASGVTASAQPGVGAAGVTAALGTQPGAQTEPTSVSNFLSPENPIVQESTKQLMEWLNPEADRQLLNDHIKQLSADRAELAGLKTDLMSTKRVMAGTEQDLRDEITKSNGFATDSLVQALTIGRNKTLVQKAQLISDQIQSQVDLVNSDISLIGDEKQMASQQFSQRMSLLQYQQTNAQNSANATRDMYKTLIDKNPEYLYNTLLADPTQAKRFQTLTGIGIDALKGMTLNNTYQSVTGKDGTLYAFNPKTGKYEDSGLGTVDPTTDRKTEVVKRADGTQYLMDSSTGDPIKELDNSNKSKEAANIQTAKDSVQSLDALLTHRGLNGAVGANPFARSSPDFNAFTGVRQDFIASVQQITSELTLDKLIQAKANGATFGALSDGEREILAASASKISTWAIKDSAGNIKGYNTSEKSFKAEIQRIRDLTNRAVEKASALQTEYQGLYNQASPEQLQQLNKASSNGKEVVAGYDITSYATDPSHGQKVASIYQKIPEVNTPESIDSYIRRLAPNSPIRGTDVMTASTTYGVDPKLVLAIMVQDSSLGTKGKAVRTKNPGNVGNTDSGATKNFDDWASGVMAVAKNLAWRKLKNNA